MTQLVSQRMRAATAKTPRTSQQKWFDRVVRQVERARKQLADWQKGVPAFRQSHHELIEPLQNELAQTVRQFVFELEKVLQQPGFTRSERTLMRDILCGRAGELLDAERGDDELRALFDKYSDIGYDAEKDEERAALKGLAEAFTGFDLGDDDFDSDEELMQRMHEKMTEHAHTAKPQRRKPTAKQAAAEARRAEQAKLATQSVRDVYRKLASALHPDKEPDAAKRDAKTELMQKVNRAYEGNDLLTLLEAQLQLEQLDAGQLAKLSGDRLMHYIRVLEEQKLQLNGEVDAMELQFCVEFQLEPFGGVDPTKLGPMLKQIEREIKADITLARSELRRLSDKAAVKAWLKRERRSRREDDELDYIF